MDVRVLTCTPAVRADTISIERMDNMPPRARLIDRSPAAPKASTFLPLALHTTQTHILASDPRQATCVLAMDRKATDGRHQIVCYMLGNGHTFSLAILVSCLDTSN